ncbi:hypothetical protein TCE0_033r08133 [Talaromyces pinophilus]|uniref:F-box domain-containing protein n=1 Tax=Talaromyces pinophilus TaxID=128442 RepID=A0A6V8H8X7_TALPI|nr:hypothetical protein TCE0_033r08133 [Talaromyces pinophilus]
MEDQSLHSLRGYPMELCQCIFSYLSKTDYFNLCLVHGRLRTIAEPYLYSEIQFTWEEKLQPHPITSLLRSLLRRPQLATFIRRLSLADFNFYNPYSEDRAPKILVSEDALKELIAFVMKATVPYRQIWLEELQNVTMDAFVALLLSQPLRLSCLAIDGDFLWESKLIGLVLRSMLFEPDAHYNGLRLDLSHLETVSLQASGDRFRFYNNARNTDDILPIFYLPSVKRISASVDNPSNFSWPGTTLPSPAKLRNLKLENIREPFLGQLLSVISQLQYLHWRWYYFEDVYDKQFRTRIIDLTQITKSISYVRETLTELIISATAANDPEPPPLIIRGSMKGMRDFKKLIKLTVSRTFLMGGWSLDLTKRVEEYLPQNLKFLTMTDDLATHEEYDWADRDLYCMLERLLKACQTSTPHLCEIKVMTHRPYEITAQTRKLGESINGVSIQFEEPASLRGHGRGRGRGRGIGRVRPTWYEPIW